MLITVPDAAVPFIKLHRTHLHGDDEVLKAQYLAELDIEFAAIKEHLPPKLEAMVDIGCGMAGISLMIYKAIGGCKLHLIDGTGTAPLANRIGFRATMEPFSSREVANEFLVANGVRLDDVLWYHPSGSFEPVKLDFAISLLSCGWHYPVSTYFPWLMKSLRPGGRLVIDVRHATDGMETLCRRLKPVRPLGQNDKGARWVFENPWEGFLNRYQQLDWCIAEVKPATIIEVGTWNGGRAVQMVTEALKHSPTVHYTGFDLFEEATAETDILESNVKPHYTVAQVSNRLNEFAGKNPGFSFELVKGNTRTTLAGKKRKADFCFIDGGHSVETIMSDYAALGECGFIVLDDFYEYDADGRCLDTMRFGCNALAAAVEMHVLPIADPVRGGGLVRLAVVGERGDVFKMESKSND